MSAWWASLSWHAALAITIAVLLAAGCLISAIGAESKRRRYQRGYRR